MLNIERLRRIKLTRKPPLQYLLTYGLVGPSFALPRRTEVAIEGLSHLPKDAPVFLAMNHTDRYNSFPFQAVLLRRGYRCAAAWVKGKYYENPLMAWFLTATNNIPLPSRGYVLATEFRRVVGRVPSDAEYPILRGLVGGSIAPEDIVDDALSAATGSANDQALQRFFDAMGGPACWVNQFRDMFDEMIGESVRLTREALFDYGLNLLIHPEGTRSLRLARGQTGIVQVAQHLGVPIVPVGCNGTDVVFPGKLPVPRVGTITYRVGAPLAVDDPEIRSFRVPSEVPPLTQAANDGYGVQYRQITDVLMRRLSALLDPVYQPDPCAADAPAQGMGRFI